MASLRLAHLADAHLGLRQYHRLTPAGINQREADVANAFRAVVDGIIAAGPDAVLIAGDFFHAVRPTNAAIVFAFRQLQRLRDALPDAPVILIAGNHDTPRSSETGSILRLFEELGVDVAVDEPRRLHYPSLDLTVLAVPHQTLVAPERLPLRPDGSATHEVLLLHGEVEGVFPFTSWALEYGGALVDVKELREGGWSYVALGHYHVRYEVAPRIWYAGALEYASPNLWGELADEARLGVEGKAWLLVDVETGVVAPQDVPPARGVLDLPALDAQDLAPDELDRLLAARLAAVPGGLADQVIRLVVVNVPRHVVRLLDHAAIRAWKAEALHLHLDFRRPEPGQTTGLGALGRRQTLPEMVRDYLARRPLPDRVERERFVGAGLELLREPEGGEGSEV